MNFNFINKKIKLGGSEIRCLLMILGAHFDRSRWRALHVGRQWQASTTCTCKVLNEKPARSECLGWAALRKRYFPFAFLVAGSTGSVHLVSYRADSALLGGLFVGVVVWGAAHVPADRCLYPRVPLRPWPCGRAT